MAGRIMSRRSLNKRRGFVKTGGRLVLYKATGIELATGRRVQGGRNAALQNYPAGRGSFLPYPGDGGKQGFCIWVLGRGEDLFRRAHLHYLSQVHDDNPVTHIADNAQVMGDK